MAVQWMVRVGAVGMALLFAAPALARSAEPPARIAAALADYRQTCAPLFGRYDGRGGVDNEFLWERDDTGSSYSSDQYFGLRDAEGMRIRLGNATGEAARYPSPQKLLVKCAAEVALRHAIYGVPGYDHGASSARPSAPAPRPNVAAKPAVPSNPAISTQQARDNAENVAMMKEIGVLKKLYPHVTPCPWRGDGSGIQNSCLKSNFQNRYIMSEAVLAMLEARRNRVSPEYYAKAKAAWEKDGREWARVGCANLARSTTPCGLPVADSAYGKKSRIIARDGRHALDCVKLETVASGDSSLSGGRRVLSNRCAGVVEIAWCSTGGECEREIGNSWTIEPGQSWPVSASNEVRWGACHGANTIHGDPGSKGLNFTCSKPVKR